MDRKGLLEDDTFGLLHRCAVGPQELLHDPHGGPVLEDPVAGALRGEPQPRHHGQRIDRGAADVQSPLLDGPHDSIEPRDSGLVEVHDGSLAQKLRHVDVGVLTEHLDAELGDRVERVRQRIPPYFGEREARDLDGDGQEQRQGCRHETSFGR